MWASISAIVTLAVMIFKLWVDNETAKEAKFNDDKKSIIDAVSSGDVSRIHRIIDSLRR